MANTTPDLLSAVSVLGCALDAALIGTPYEVGSPDAQGRRYFQLKGAVAMPVYEAGGRVTPVSPDDALEEPAERAFRTWLAGHDARGAELAREYATIPSAPKPAALAALGLGLCRYCPPDEADIACECACPGAVAARASRCEDVTPRDARGEAA